MLEHSDGNTIGVIRGPKFVEAVILMVGVAEEAAKLDAMMVFGCRTSCGALNPLKH